MCRKDKILKNKIVKNFNRQLKEADAMADKGDIVGCLDKRSDAIHDFLDVLGTLSDCVQTQISITNQIYEEHKYKQIKETMGI